MWTQIVLKTEQNSIVFVWKRCSVDEALIKLFLKTEQNSIVFVWKRCSVDEALIKLLLENKITIDPPAAPPTDLS